MIDFIQEIYGTVMRNKLRTLLTGFAVSWGIFMLIVLLGAGNGVINAMMEQSADLNLNSVEVYPGKTTEAYKGLREGRNISFTDKDRQTTRHHFPDEIAETGATLSLSSTTLSNGGNYVSLSLNGVTPNLRQINGVKLVEGRFVNRADIEQRRKVIVIHTKTAETLFKNKYNGVGQYVRAGQSEYLVAGIYTDRGNIGTPDAYVPLTTLQTVYGKGDSLSTLAFNTQGMTTEAANDTFDTRFRTLMGKEHLFNPDDRGAIWISNHFTQYLQQQTGTNILRIAIWVVGLLTLLSGVVGVSNIMLITVKERTHEFGIRKALGATPFSILKLIIVESIVITTFFGYIGMVAGIGATEYMNILAGEQTMNAGAFTFTFFKNPTVSIGVAVQATLTLIIAGTLAGFFPARKAALVRPIEALRN